MIDGFLLFGVSNVINDVDLADLSRVKVNTSTQNFITFETYYKCDTLVNNMNS